MGVRGTLILALLTLVVGALVWLEEVPRDGTSRPPDTLLGEPRADQQVRHLLEFTPADILSVQLERGDMSRQARRSGATWSTANPAAVDDFLENLSQLGVLMDIPAGEGDLPDYGLNPPQSVIRLQVRGQMKPLILQVGDRNPSVTGVYVRLGEKGPVLLAGALVAWEFDKAFRALGPEDQR
jgi:hypothetical protein